MGKKGGKGKQIIKDAGVNEVAEVQPGEKEDEAAPVEAAEQSQEVSKKGKKDGKKKKGKSSPEEMPPEGTEPPKQEIKQAPAEETPKEEKPKKEKKDKKGKEKEEKQEEAAIAGDALAGKKKGGKGKKIPADAAEETEQETTKKAKGKKGKKAEDHAEVSEAAAEDGKGDGEVVPEGKGKKGKGKKGKKDKKNLQPETSKLNMQMSISAFLQQHASVQDDDEWTWESYSASTVSIKEEVPKKGKKSKGKGKGKDKKKKGEKAEEPGVDKPGEEAALETEKKAEKKGKGKGKGKGKKEKKEKDEGSEQEEELDIMAQINKMKEMAAAEAMGDVVVEEQTAAPKKKGKKKKGEGEAKQKGPKLSKKEKAKLAAEMAEQARIQAELDAKQAEEDERIRLIEERKAAIEKQKREISEQYIRTEQLNNSISLINLIKKNNMEKAIEHKQMRQWEEFLKCDGLPDPYVCGQLNTYLHLWKTVIKSTTIDDAATRTIEALKLLNLLTTLIDDPVGVEQSKIDNWKWVHRIFREHQRESLDAATYRLLRDISHKLNRVNFHQADFQRKENDFCLRLWLLIKLPQSLPTSKRPTPERIKMDAPDMLMTVLFPTSLECKCMAIRAMYLKYDHLSNLCATYDQPPIPEEYQADLYKVTLEEWYSKIYYKYQNRTIPEGAPPPENVPEVDREKGIIPIVPYEKLEPTASAYFNEGEDALYLQVRDNLITKVDEHVINLRKYAMLGGTYCLNLYYQPPQPQEIFTFCMTVTRLEIPKCLYDVSFYIKYETPPPIDPTKPPINPANPTLPLTPEEIAEEMKRREEELDQLLVFTITLPNHVMWFDVPSVCHWDEKRQVWSTEDVHDLQHSEDKSYLTFRSGAFGFFSFAVYRYANLPFQGWEMKPEVDGTVTLQITAAVLLIEFNVKENLICVTQFQNAPNKALRHIIGIYYRLPKLIRILQEGGVDIFPAFDAFCYIEGTCEKHWPIERHTYYNMGQLSVCYNFMWSRWNITAGRRNIVMQMRLYKPEKDKQIPHSMLLVTPLKASYIECNEDSEEFTDESIAGMHFYSDLYNLMKGTTSMSLRSKVQSASCELVVAVAELLLATRIVSFS